MRGVVGVLIVTTAVVLLVTASQPIPFGSAASDSMAPTIERGETFLALPPAVVGGVDVGDIGVFRGADGWTVHRIVEISDGAAVTKGDANVITDQQAGSPPVPIGSIEGVVPEYADRPLSTGVSPRPLSRWQLGLIGGLLVGFVLFYDLDHSPLSPPQLALLAGGVVILAWILDSGGEAGVATVIANQGPIPTMVLSGSSPSASILWPTQELSQPAADAITLPGVAPPSLVETALGYDARVGVGVVALFTGAVTGGFVAMIGWWIGP